MKRIYDDTQEDPYGRTLIPMISLVYGQIDTFRKVRYNCGPVGQDVPHVGLYIVRPCVNMLGLGLGAKQMWLDKDTTSTLDIFGVNGSKVYIEC